LTFLLCASVYPRLFFFHRAAVQPGFSKKTFIPYKPTFGDNFVQGNVVDIDIVNKTVTVDNRKVVPKGYF